MARIKYLDSNGPNNPLAPPIVQTDYAFKRGRNPGFAVRFAGTGSGMGQHLEEFAASQKRAKVVLNEALGD